MALRDDLLTIVDTARGLVEDFGLRQHTVYTRRRTWSGTEPGDGTATDVDVELTPRPKVRVPGPRLVFDAAGAYEAGDLLVSKVSALLDEEDLTGGALAADEEWFFVVGGDLYTLVGEPERRNFEWRVQLRRVTATP